MSPATLILIGLLVLALLVWVIWPQKGLLAILERMRMNTLKVQMEDALKFLYDCEYKDINCNLHSIAGNLHISSNKTAAILDRLHDLGLAESKGDTFLLTDAGRSYALRVIRVHRIWERYLADETSVDQKDWHGVADKKEHQLTVEAAEAIASKIGNPVYDPHGDPIPSASGDMPQHRGINLTDLNEGDIGIIIHIEDEPGYIYQQLSALGLYPGMQVYVLDVTEGKITFAAEGEELILTPLFASAVTVQPLPDQQPVSEKQDLLSSLDIGEKAIVKGISANCRGQQRRRLLDLGIVPGTVIAAVIRSASGDPVGYNIMGATIGIRKKQADLIFIDKKRELNEQPA